MPNRKRSTGPRSVPKLFQCTGYGNCDMVFTRSEHLARHERKHTGEKPYACIVPSCNRRFSRFDNMMQHTQIHEKRKHNTSNSSSNTGSGTTAELFPTPMKHEPTAVIPSLIVPASMIDSRELPLPLPLPLPRRVSLTYTSTMYHHLPYPLPQHAQQNTQMENHHVHRRLSTTSTQSSESTMIVSPVASHGVSRRRRISLDDLGLPIEDLKNIQLEEKSTKLDAVDITLDEYEALEGFSRFHTKSVVAPMPCFPMESPILRNESPNFASQVCAMRQRVMALNESFSRR